MKKINITSLLMILGLYSLSQNVGIGTTSPEAKVHIKGNEDVSQLVIDANSTQSNTQPLLMLRNNSGAELLRIHTDAEYNVFIGFGAGQINNINFTYNRGLFNTFIGSNSGFYNTTGSFNTALGRSALYQNNSGIYNTGQGYKALWSNTAGNYNTAIGSEALLYNIGGSYNTATGNQALYSNNYGTYNSAYGDHAFRSNTTGSENTAIGAYSLFTQSYANGGILWLSNNTAIGYQALFNNAPTNNTNGIKNTAVGAYALLSNTTGGNNTSIGYGSDVDLTGSNNNTVLGSAAHIYGNNDVVIGYGAYTNASNIALLGSTTTVYCGGYANWSNFSDGRFKTRVNEDVKGLDFIMRLRPVTYHMDVRGIYNLWGISPYGKEDKNISRNASMKEENKRQMDEAITNKEAIRMSGFIAQEVEKAAQQSGYDFDGVIKPQHDKDHYRLAYGEFVVPIVKAMQEQQKMIEQLKQMVLQQQNEIEALKKKN